SHMSQMRDFFFQAEDGIRDRNVTGVQTCALPIFNTKIRVPKDSETITDVTRLPDIQELYLASDMLVTDYSSVFFDYSLLKRPISFYAYDLEKYRQELRGFYLDYSTELPGPIVESADALYRAIDTARET